MGLKFVIATFLALASLTVLQVLGTNSSNDGPRHCYNGQTGANTGESASIITMSTFQRNESESGHLVSPLMCEVPRVDLCLKFRYRILNNNGRGMTFFLNCINMCDKPSEWIVKSSVGNAWQDAQFTFKSPGNFTMIIEAHKHSGYYGSDNDFQIDGIAYFNTACNKSPAIAPPTSSVWLSQTSSLSTPEVHSLSEIASGLYLETNIPEDDDDTKSSQMFIWGVGIIFAVSIAGFVGICIFWIKNRHKEEWKTDLEQAVEGHCSQVNATGSNQIFQSDFSVDNYENVNDLKQQAEPPDWNMHGIDETMGNLYSNDFTKYNITDCYYNNVLNANA